MSVPASTDPIHETAAAGYAAGSETYASGRPEYPPAIRDWLRDVVAIGPGSSVVDLGAGTGKFTRLLVATGAAVTAVEPVAEMLARLSADLPQATGVQGTATAIPRADNSVDAVVCAQAFHWFASREALDEIVRVLRPGGRLALVWNLRDPQVPWVQRLDAIVDRFERDVPRFYKGTWLEAFPHPQLSALKESRFQNTHAGKVEDVIIKRVLSTSFISALPADQRRGIEVELRHLVASEPEIRNRETVEVPYRTFAFCAVRTEDAVVRS